MEYGVYRDLIIMYPKPYFIYLRGTILAHQAVSLLLVSLPLLAEHGRGDLGQGADPENLGDYPEDGEPPQCHRGATSQVEAGPVAPDLLRFVANKILWVGP